MICLILGIFSAIARKMAGNKERTFIMVKPDGVQRGLVGEILKRFEAKGFKLVALKLVWVSFIHFNWIKEKCKFSISTCGLNVRLCIFTFFVEERISHA